MKFKAVGGVFVLVAVPPVGAVGHFLEQFAQRLEPFGGVPGVHRNGDAGIFLERRGIFERRGKLFVKYFRIRIAVAGSQQKTFRQRSGRIAERLFLLVVPHGRRADHPGVAHCPAEVENDLRLEIAAETAVRIDHRRKHGVAVRLPDRPEVHDLVELLVRVQRRQKRMAERVDAERTPFFQQFSTELRPEPPDPAGIGEVKRPLDPVVGHCRMGSVVIERIVIPPAGKGDLVPVGQRHRAQLRFLRLRSGRIAHLHRLNVTAHSGKIRRRRQCRRRAEYDSQPM